MDPNLLVDIEEFLNGTGSIQIYNLQTYSMPFPPNLIPDIDGKLNQPAPPGSKKNALYADAIEYIKRLGNKEFLKKRQRE